MASSNGWRWLGGQEEPSGLPAPTLSIRTPPGAYPKFYHHPWNEIIRAKAYSCSYPGGSTGRECGHAMPPTADLERFGYWYYVSSECAATGCWLSW